MDLQFVQCGRSTGPAAVSANRFWQTAASSAGEVTVRRERKKRTTKIRVLGETWHVPRGFGKAYARAAKDDLDLVRAAKPGEVIGSIIDLLALIGYQATIEQVADWNLRKRVEAVVYAATEYARASDNPIQRHPRPSWLPANPWQGPPRDVSHIRADLRGAFEGPSGTPILEASP